MAGALFDRLVRCCRAVVRDIAGASRDAPRPQCRAGQGGAGWRRRHVPPFGGKALIALQVALSLVLLVGAGLFVRTLLNLRSQAIGFRPDQILLFEMDASASGYRHAAL